VDVPIAKYLQTINPKGEDNGHWLDTTGNVPTVLLRISKTTDLPQEDKGVCMT
jgi:hypothetical protein